MNTLLAASVTIPLSATTLALAVLLVALGLFIGFIVYAYNRLVRLRNLAEEGWSGVDVQLRRRHDLIPNLVETVRGYATHESDTLEAVTAKRSQSEATDTRRALQDQENALTGRIKTLFAIAEDYPELKASRNFRDLSAQLVDIEDDLQKARRYFNGAVRQLNITVESFPTNLVAGILGFASREYFEVESALVRSNPGVEL